MDNVTPKLAATFGVGFLGFILAAYSYNKYHKPDYTEELLKTTDEDNDNETVSEDTHSDIKQEMKDDNWRIEYVPIFEELSHTTRPYNYKNPEHKKFLETTNLEEDIKFYEPKISLDGGSDGLREFKKVI